MNQVSVIVRSQVHWNGTFVVVPYETSQLYPAIEDASAVDFVFANPAVVACASLEFSTRPLATIARNVRTLSSEPSASRFSTSIGGVFLALKNRTDLVRSFRSGRLVLSVLTQRDAVIRSPSRCEVTPLSPRRMASKTSGTCAWNSESFSWRLARHATLILHPGSGIPYALIPTRAFLSHPAKRRATSGSMVRARQA